MKKDLKKLVLTCLQEVKRIISLPFIFIFYLLRLLKKLMLFIKRIIVFPFKVLKLSYKEFKIWLKKKYYRILVTFKYKYLEYKRIVSIKYNTFRYWIRGFEFKKKLKIFIPYMFNIVFTGYLVHFVFPIMTPLRLGIGIALISKALMWFYKIRRTNNGNTSV